VRFLGAYQMQALYSNVNYEAVALNLTPGVALTASEQASLTRDIIWPVASTSGNKKIYKPRVYLSHVTQQRLTSLLG